MTERDIHADKKQTERVALASAALAAVTKPMTFLQIESMVGVQENYELGIVLTNLVIDKRLHYRGPVNYASHCPVYSNAPIPKDFKFLQRVDA